VSKIPDRIVDISMDCVIVRKGITAFTNGRASYAEALEAIVVAQYHVNLKLKEQLITLYQQREKPLANF